MEKSFRTLDDYDIEGKRVLVRADLNVPLEEGIVRDSTRIERIAPTLEELASKGAIVVVLSHLGRPRGAVVPNMSLAPLVGPLSVAIDRPVRFVATTWTNGEAQRAVSNAKPGDILLLENTRFHPGEEKNQPRFVKMPDIMKAKRKPMDVIPADELGVEVPPALTVTGLATPPKRSGGTRVEDVDALIEGLKARGVL